MEDKQNRQLSKENEILEIEVYENLDTDVDQVVNYWYQVKNFFIWNAHIFYCKI